MVDLETLGKRAGCQILSIGAVFFNRETDALGEKFYSVCRIGAAQTNLGLHTDKDTLKWWQQQSEDSRRVLHHAKAKGATSLPSALEKFTEFLETAEGGLSRVRVWGNGSDFDNAILYAAYAAAHQEVPWKFWHSRCFRTLKSENRNILEPVREGTYHNALDDAVHQALWALRIFKALAAPPPKRRSVKE